MSRLRRVAWMVAAYVLLGIGIAAIFIPGLPTTVFVLLAAFCASRGSPRLHAWLLRHRIFGPTITAWQEEGAVPRRAKVVATATMLVCAAILVVYSPAWAAVVGSATMATVCIWLWLRPEPSRTVG